MVSGRLVLPIPDVPTATVHHWGQLKYDQGRDARTFADRTCAAVERFMDGMLGAFEDAKLEIEHRRAAVTPVST
jgi:hypothetical protein